MPSQRSILAPADSSINTRADLHAAPRQNIANDWQPAKNAFKSTPISFSKLADTRPIRGTRGNEHQNFEASRRRAGFKPKGLSTAPQGPTLQKASSAQGSKPTATKNNARRTGGPIGLFFRQSPWCWPATGHPNRDPRWRTSTAIVKEVEIHQATPAGKEAPRQITAKPKAVTCVKRRLSRGLEPNS